MALKSVNPATEVEIARFAEDTPSEVELKLSRAAEAARTWRRTSFDERAVLMRRAASHIRENRDRLSRIVSAEMGKPIVQSRRETDRFAGRCDYFAEHTGEMLAPERVTGADLDGWIRFEPLGVALGIMPWNFPFGQASRWAVPAMMVGNVAVLKHASNVTMSALAIEEVFAAAGFPRGVFTPLLVGSDRIGSVIADPRIAAVSLTGSTAAGEDVGAMAGQHLKKLVLELGGSDPFVVLKDADPQVAADAAARGRFLNNSGQQCTAAKRFIVVREVVDSFTEAFIAETRKLRTGDPMEEVTDVGPLARAEGLAELTQQLESSTRAGARVVYRADLDLDRGYYFPPTLLDQVTTEMAVAQQETFGPLAAIISVRGEREAIDTANQSPYGLGCSIWTSDAERGSALAADLDAGMVAINSLVVADPRLPFGGVKRSGFGREMSVHGLREMTNIKAVNIGSSKSPRFSR